MTESRPAIDHVLRTLSYQVESCLDWDVDRLPDIDPCATNPDGRRVPDPPEASVEKAEPAAKNVGGAPQAGAEHPVPTIPPARQPSLFDDLQRVPEAVSPEAALADLTDRIASCRRCKLHQHRQHAVPGEGPPQAELIFVGEGPGADEDRLGRPFVGRAGRLLDKIIGAMRLRRDQVYIANIVKCRPPGNRTPEREEVRACLPYLHEQIATLSPRVIVALGTPATRALLDIDTTITRARGRVYRLGAIRVVPTFHPAYLLRNPSAKAQVWEDMQLVMRLLADTGP